MNVDKSAAKKKTAAVADVVGDVDMDHPSYHDAPEEGEDDQGFGENEISRHSENDALQGLYGGTGSDFDEKSGDDDEEESKEKKKKKHDKDKKSKKIKKEKKDKKHKKDKKKHKKHSKNEGEEEEAQADN